MLIKKTKLRGSILGITEVADSESAQLTQFEIHKAKQEAKVIKKEAEEILLESQKKLKEATEKAKQIAEDANHEATRLKEKVYKETLEKATEEADLMKEEVRQLLEEIFQVKEKALKEAHNEIIKVALDLAEKIIRYKASIDPEILKTQVTEAIKKATSEADRVQVYVNPSDIENLERTIPAIEKLFPQGLSMVRLTNDSIDIGSCIIETKSGQLDASFSTQLKTLTNLISHIEVEEPEIKIDEEEEPEIFPQEEEKLKEELLSEEPLIQLDEIEKETETVKMPNLEVIEEPSFEEVEEYKAEEGSMEEGEEKILEVPQEVAEEITQVEQQIHTPSEKKKLVIDNLFERTKEEQEELNFEFEEEEKKEENKPTNILKPKKTKPHVSDIAKEVEQSPEWKDLLEDEE